MTGVGAVPLSVVVAAWSGTEALARCLAALVPQLGAGDEVVVARNFSDTSVDSASAPFSGDSRVRVVQCASGINVPRLRAAGLAVSRGNLVAFLEDHAEPLAGWRNAIVAAFGSHPDFAAVGGPVAPPERSAALDDAIWFYDYARFAPPQPSAIAVSLSGVNVAYTRAALTDALGHDPRFVEEGLHEASVERILIAGGARFWMAGDAVVRVTRRETPRRAVSLAFALARGYAARRATSSGVALRTIRILAAPILPFVLFVRSARSAWHVPSLRVRFIRAAGWLLLLQGAWSAGEGVGGCLGAGDSDSRWR